PHNESTAIVTEPAAIAVVIGDGHRDAAIDPLPPNLTVAAASTARRAGGLLPGPPAAAARAAPAATRPRRPTNPSRRGRRRRGPGRSRRSGTPATAPSPTDGRCRRSSASGARAA